MKVLITGANGFVGSHLIDYLIEKDETIEIHAMTRYRSNLENIKHSTDKINIIKCDLTDFVSVKKTIKHIKPHKIFHLAAQSFVPASWSQPQQTFITNIIGTLNVFEAILDTNINPKTLIAGSSEEYGNVKQKETPIKETNELKPLSPYGVSKVAQDRLAYQYHQSYGLNTIITRAFNHTGPRRTDCFVCSSFAKQIAAIEKNKTKPILSVGNLNTKRDFTDVRDMVKAYWLATEKCNFGEPYNISSGKSMTIQNVLNTLLFFSEKNIQIITDSNRLRPSDVPILEGDSTKFRRKTRWKPKIKFKQTMLDLLDYWRSKP